MLTFARATMADQERIRAFLSQFSGDYLIDQFTRYLGPYVGGLYMAEDGDQLVGAGIVTLPRRREALLSGLRIAPDRQDDVAEAFIRYQLEEAKRLGAEVVRVLVPQDNATATHVLQDQLGFREIDQWAVGEISPLPNPDRRPDEAGMAWAVDRDRIANFIRQHPGDLWAPNLWEPRTLSITDVERRFEEGGLAIVPQHGDVEGLAITTVQAREFLHIGYLRALGQAVQSLLDYLWNEARAWGITRCRFGLPVQAAERLRALVPNTEITWRGLVLERQLNLSPSEG